MLNNVENNNKNGSRYKKPSKGDLNSEQRQGARFAHKRTSFALCKSKEKKIGYPDGRDAMQLKAKKTEKRKYKEGTSTASFKVKRQVSI